MTRIGLKDLRENIDKYAKLINKGESFVVMRKAEPWFKIAPLDEGVWEEVIDLYRDLFKCLVSSFFYKNRVTIIC